MFPRIVLNELIKELLIVWSYRLQWVGEIVSLIIFFMFLFNLTNETEYAAISYCLWFYSILIIGDISGKISVDMKAGTFEQVYLSIVPFKKLLIAKILSSIIRSTVLVAILLLVMFIFNYFSYCAASSCIFILTILAITPCLIGISLCLAGLTILLKNISWLTNVINNSLLFLSGIFVSIDSNSMFFNKIAKFCIVNIAIETIKCGSFSSTYHSLILNNVLSVLLGLQVLKYCEKKAKTRGIFGYH